MNHVLGLLQNEDLTSTGQRLLTLIETHSILIAFVLGVLVLLGFRMCALFPRLRIWGLRIALLVFVLHLVYTCATQGFDPQVFGWTMLRSANVAGFVLAPLWLCFPVLLFVYSRFRLALAAFMLYTAYAWFATANWNTSELPRIAIEAVIASGVVLLVSWIIQPVTDFVMKSLLPQKTAKLAQSPTLAPEPRMQERPVPREAESTWRLREAAAELLSLKKTQLRQETEQNAEKGRRRQRARLKAELCYTLNEPALVTTFPRPMFEDFVSRYLSDQYDPETLEENAKELEAMILRHVSNRPVEVQPIDLSDLTEWFVGEQNKIRHDEADTDRKKTKLAGLTRRYSQLAERLIEDGTN